MNPRVASYSVRLENLPGLKRNFDNKVNIFGSFSKRRIPLAESLITLSYTNAEIS